MAARVILVAVQATAAELSRGSVAVVAQREAPRHEVAPAAVVAEAAQGEEAVEEEVVEVVGEAGAAGNAQSVA